jgi:hypothetical protein
MQALVKCKFLAGLKELNLRHNNVSDKGLGFFPSTYFL